MTYKKINQRIYLTFTEKNIEFTVNVQKLSITIIKKQIIFIKFPPLMPNYFGSQSQNQSIS